MPLFIFILQTLARFTLGIIASLFLLVATPSLSTAASRFIAIGTGGPTGTYFVVGNAICRMVDKAAAEGRSEERQNGLRCSAPSTAGSIYNIAQLRAGALDFAIVQSDWQYHAYYATSKFEGKRFKDLRAVFSVHAEPFQILVGGASGIRGWDGLRGKRVNIGNLGSGQRSTMEILMKIHNTSKDDFKQASELASSEQSQALCDGKIDAYGYTVGVPNAGVAQAADGCGARIISLATAPIEKLVENRPYYTFTTIPRNTYKTTKSDVRTFGPKATLVTSGRTSDVTVYEVVRAVFENLEKFKKQHPSFKRLDSNAMISEGLSAPFHQGAIRYYKEKGWM